MEDEHSNDNEEYIDEVEAMDDMEYDEGMG